MYTTGLFCCFFVCFNVVCVWWVTAWNVTSSDNTPTSLLGLLGCTTNCNVITIDINCGRIQNVYSPTAALFSHAKYTYRLLCCVMRETLESGGGDAGLFGYCVAFPVALCLPAFIEWRDINSRALHDAIARTAGVYLIKSRHRLRRLVCLCSIPESADGWGVLPHYLSAHAFQLSVITPATRGRE